MISVIGFVGKMKSGKTTGAKHLVYTKQYTRLRVADGLKKMLKDGLGINEEYIDGDLKNVPCEQLCGQTVRHAMITFSSTHLQLSTSYTVLYILDALHPLSFLISSSPQTQSH